MIGGATFIRLKAVCTTTNAATTHKAIVATIAIAYFLAVNALHRRIYLVVDSNKTLVTR